MISAERLRRRRCLALQVAVILGIFLVASQRHWVTITVVAVSFVLIAVVYMRNCRSGRGAQTSQGDTHA